MYMYNVYPLLHWRNFFSSINSATQTQLGWVKVLYSEDFHACHCKKSVQFSPGENLTISPPALISKNCIMLIFYPIKDCTEDMVDLTKNFFHKIFQIAGLGEIIVQ